MAKTVASVITGSYVKFGVQLIVTEKVCDTWLELIVATRSKSYVPGGSEATGCTVIVVPDKVIKLATVLGNCLVALLVRV